MAHAARFYPGPFGNRAQQWGLASSGDPAFRDSAATGDTLPHPCVSSPNLPAMNSRAALFIALTDGCGTGLAGETAAEL
jgi:hypothetical protein